MALEAVLAVAFAVGLNLWAGCLGYATVFYHTLVHALTHPLSAPAGLTVSQYLLALRQGLSLLPWNTAFLAFLSVVLLGWPVIASYLQPDARPARRPASLFIVTALYFVARLLLLPDPWDRYFVGVYLCAVIALGAWLSVMVRLDQPRACLARTLLPIGRAGREQ